MKKLYLVLSISLVLVLAFAVCARADNTIKIGAEFSGVLNPNGDNYTVNTGYSVGYEYTVPQGPLEYGAGFEYPFYRTVQGNSSLTIPDGSQFNFIPVYGVIKYNFNDDKQAQPYVTARLGYNFVYGDSNFTKNISSLTGGFYYAVGVGMNFNQIVAEILFSSNHGTGKSYDLLYNSWALRFGYKF